MSSEDSQAGEAGPQPDGGPALASRSGPSTAVLSTAVPTAPPTGDPAIDAALRELDVATGEPLAQHIVAGERVHQVLQGRLSNLGGA